jgi:hypothetical protein
MRTENTITLTLRRSTRNTVSRRLKAVRWWDSVFMKPSAVHVHVLHIHSWMEFTGIHRSSQLFLPSLPANKTMLHESGKWLLALMELRFLLPGTSNKNGRPLTEIMNLKKKLQSLKEFPFIWPNNFTFSERRESVFLFKIFIFHPFYSPLDCSVRDGRTSRSPAYSTAPWLTKLQIIPSSVRQRLQPKDANILQTCSNTSRASVHIYKLT